jgi:DNA-binding protein H-NS
LDEELTEIRSDKTGAQNRELGERLAKLNRVKFGKPERFCPNTVIRSLHRKTWVGTGKQPRRLVAGLKIGRKLDELEIGNTEKTTRKNRTGRSQHT